MGIRYDRDSRKTTKGPMIFFSILRDETFENEIRGAYINGLNFYAYRYPRDNMMTFGTSESYLEGIEEPGFIIGLFNPDLPYITIPFSNIKRNTPDLSLYHRPQHSTKFEEYKYEVEEMIQEIKRGGCQKIVASRVIVKENKIDIAEEFYRLCDKFPEAYVYCFSTPATGCWIGASPELLLESREKNLHTMALAGTRAADDLSDWDEKNKEEQAIVVDYISSILKKHNLEVNVGHTINLQTGGIQHICTQINSSISKKESLNLTALLKDLSPTPALCGSPKQKALEEIRKLEKFDRGCYGGFCGRYQNVNDFALYVTLRCSSITETAQCIYVGGGITSKSEVSAEWNETELKAQNTFLL